MNMFYDEFISRKQERLARGDVMVDENHLYVVLERDDSEPEYKILILSEYGYWDDFAPGTVTCWGWGCENDTRIGNIDLPANL